MAIKELKPYAGQYSLGLNNRYTVYIGTHGGITITDNKLNRNLTHHKHDSSLAEGYTSLTLDDETFEHYKVDEVAYYAAGLLDELPLYTNKEIIKLSEWFENELPTEQSFIESLPEEIDSFGYSTFILDRNDCRVYFRRYEHTKRANGIVEVSYCATLYSNDPHCKLMRKLYGYKHPSKIIITDISRLSNKTRLELIEMLQPKQADYDSLLSFNDPDILEQRMKIVTSTVDDLV